MNKASKISRYFLFLAVFFLTFCWLVFIFSVTGLFYRETVALSIVFSLIFLLFIKGKIKEEGANFSRKVFALVFLVSLAASSSVCYFTTPTVFGGRDQGAISTAAIYLSRNHEFKFSTSVSEDLFKKYGPGRALNYPGFDYTKDGELVSRFPPAYTSYLAATYTLFGLKGIQYANLPFLFLFLIIFWLILLETFPGKISFLGFLAAATFFPFLWFSKYALTEIFTLFLVWAGIYFLIQCRKAIFGQKELVFFWAGAAIAAFSLSAFARIEGIAFLFLAMAYLAAIFRKKGVKLPKNGGKYLSIFLAIFILAYVFLNFPALSDSAKNLAKSFIPGSSKDSVPSANLYEQLGRIFFNYNIILYFIVGVAGIAWILKDAREKWTSREFLIFFVTFPAFFYLITPQISLDDPWLLRRFVFAVFPALIFYAIYALNRFFRHKIFLYVILLFFVTANFFVSWRFLTYSENKWLLEATGSISEHFSPNDLVLVDREASGSGFSLLSEPMSAIYGKNAVYFFNADDLKYINQERYENIYLIGPPADKNAWYAELVKDRPFEGVLIVNSFLEPSEEKFAQARMVSFLDFADIWKIK